MQKNISVAIDGPAGSGKSTVADMLAKRLSFVHMDTGAMYRAIGYKALSCKTDLNSEAAVCAMMKDTDIDVRFDSKLVQRVYIDGVDITDKIRTNDVSDAASKVASLACVRERLVNLQRDIACKYSVVLEGRDTCKYVLPEAEVKVYLTASTRERAMRRLNELQAKGLDNGKSLDEMMNEIEERDYRDMHRALSPLSVADDARIIDSTDMTIEEVCDMIIKMVEEVI